MDIQLKELIETIKKDGVKSAEDNAAQIISAAQTQAENIIEQAKEQAKTLQETAKARVAKLERSGTEALRQAGRDLLLTLRAEMEALFAGIIKAELGPVLDEGTMREAVVMAVKILAEGSEDEYEVLIPEKAMQNLGEGLQKSLADHLVAGISIRPFSEIDAGFRVSKKDGSAFFDFSDTEIVALLGHYLKPHLQKLLEE